MVKKYFLMSVLLCASTAHAYKFFNGTIFNVNTPFRSASPENVSQWRMSFNDTRQDGLGGSLVVVPFGGTTIGHDLTEYFSPGKDTLKVLEYKSTVPASTMDPNPERDLEARNFNIQTKSVDQTFSSIINFHMRHSYFGIGIGYRQRLGRKFWLETSAPIMRVQNSIHLTEKVITDGGRAADVIGLDGSPRVGNFLQAVAQKAWKYSRLDPNADRTKWGLADIEVKIRWNTHETDMCHWRTYLGILIPTGNKPAPELLFSPVVGNNRHFGIMFGSNIGVEVFSKNGHVVRTEIDTNGRMLLPNEQIRTFNLVDKRWSRYLEMYASPEAAHEAAVTANPDSGSFGANIMTFKAKVDPRFIATFNTAVVYEYSNFLAEGGYNFFARQGEKVTVCGFDEQAAIKAIVGRGETTVARTIKNNFAGSDLPANSYTPIKAEDIDFSSASQPPVINQTFYATLGYQWTEIEVPTMISLGGSYEFSKSNAGLNRWMVWFKTGIAF